MVKFKFKNGLREVKCFVKRALMAKSSNNAVVRPKKKNQSTARSSRNNSAVASSASSAEGFIPLAARDSQWVGLEFYNPHFRSPLDEEDDVEEVELQNLAADGIEAIYLLFPGLSKNKSNMLLKEHESFSTTEITKLLVGQKADFKNMRSSKRLILTDSKLKSVPEVLQEEKIQSDTDISTTTKKSVTDCESKAVCADDEGEEPKEDKRLKKRKKKSDLKMVTVESSASFIPTNNKIKQQSTTVFQKKSSDSDELENKTIPLLPKRDSEIKH